VLAGSCAATIATAIALRVAGRSPTAKHLEPYEPQVSA
jgi:hypothetical protein